MSSCAWAALALLTYTYFGYPIVIAVLARLLPHASPVPVPDARLPMVSAFLPIFNGRAHLRAKLDSLLAQDYPPERLEVLVYCDGCSDDSEAIARAVAAEPRAAGRVRVFATAER
ncbi:MAG TPA: glycosyltransferase, partial [Polyangia bacterium]|nr:glycosyltransferase [Polyangia bacterium]